VTAATSSVVNVASVSADADLIAYSDAMTRLTIAGFEARTGIKLGPKDDAGDADDSGIA
jgi:hypothetical protein